MRLGATATATHTAGPCSARGRYAATDSALSKQVPRLEEAGWVTVEKGQVSRPARTWLPLTEAGTAAYRRHIAALTAIAGSALIHAERMERHWHGPCTRASATP
ncbi:transcriptional regulator [Streptomyces sp. NPDC012794]|uniref:transcriptional regulator n=1 Tax=Streptomyces sp. NPDC012794 TaxID=3364850 RepID=UPI0036B45ED8